MKGPCKQDSPKIYKKKKIEQEINNEVIDDSKVERKKITQQDAKK